MKSTHLIIGTIIFLFVSFTVISCNLHYGGGALWECNGVNPEGLAMAQNFDGENISFSDTLGNSLTFHVVDSFLTNPDCPSGYLWMFNGVDTNTRIFLKVHAPIPQSYQTDSTIVYEVSIDMNLADIDEGANFADFDVNRLDTTTIPYVLFGRYKYEVIPSLTTPAQNYNHVYVCTDLDAVVGTSIQPNKIYFHKGTGFIGFHDLTHNKNWYFQP